MKKYRNNLISVILFIVFILIFVPLFPMQKQKEVGKNKVEKSKPDIVLIYMDDMGYGDIEANGAIDYQTPNIDKLAAEGMRFTNFYTVAPICSASRAGLLTGAYPNRMEFPGVLFPHSKIGISSREETIAQILKKKGYATGIIGKWHLGDAKKFLPLQHGFDYYFGLPYSNDMWPVNYDGKQVKNSKMPPLPLIEGNKTIRYIRNLHDQGMLTTWYTQKAVSFIKRNKNLPFFLYFAQTDVHVPLAVPPKFRGKSKQGMFGDEVMYVDWSIGQVMKALKENGIENNTLVIFTSDNGPWLTFGNYAGSAGGLRNGKFTTFDGGVKEPCIMRWPGVIPPGTVDNKLACTIDILPTLAAITGAPLPRRKIDGVNILSLLKNKENTNPRDHLFFYRPNDDLDGVRQGKWKLVLPHTFPVVVTPGKNGHPGTSRTDSIGVALYNLRRDPGERLDVKKEHPDVVKQLMRLVKQAREDLGDHLLGIHGKNRRTPGRI